jgi:hypothetical protein
MVKRSFDHRSNIKIAKNYNFIHGYALLYPVYKMFYDIVSVSRNYSKLITFYVFVI